MGTQRLYDYIDNNPLFAFHPTEYVNDPFVIAQQHKHGRHQRRAGDRPHRPGLRRLARHAVLLRHRRAGGLQPRRRPLAGRQGDHRPALDGQGRDGLAHRHAAQSRRRRGDHPRRRPLRRHRVRRRLSARQERAGTRDGAHLHRPSEVPRPAAPGGDRGQVPAPGTGGRRGQGRHRAQGIPHHPSAERRHADQLPPDPPDRRTGHARPVLRAVAGNDLLPLHVPHEAHSAQGDSRTSSTSTTARTSPSSAPSPRRTARTSSPSAATTSTRRPTWPRWPSSCATTGRTAASARSC